MKEIDYFDSYRDLYQDIIRDVCKKYSLTSMEFHVLMFLANNPEYDTAAQIVEKRNLTKSHVSMSIRSLEERQLISCMRDPDNRRIIHLKLLGSAQEIIENGKEAQKYFHRICYQGFDEADMQAMQCFAERVQVNIDNYRKGRINDGK